MPSVIPVVIMFFCEKVWSFLIEWKQLRGRNFLVYLDGNYPLITCLASGNIWKRRTLQFILTSRLNQDWVENLFSIIRGKGGFRDNPNAEQFIDAFRYVVADKLFVQNSSSNCKVYSDKILLDIKNISMTEYKKLYHMRLEWYLQWTLQWS